MNEFSRPDRDIYFLDLAIAVSHMGTCRRRRVGCILVGDYHRILATGYNGVSRGVAHCLDYPCTDITPASGTQLDSCKAIHAEQNALIQCTEPNSIISCYTTCSPCITCVKMLMNTSCSRICFIEEYPHPEAQALWLSVGREWIQL